MELYGKKDGKVFMQMLDFHKCTDKDFEDFAPPSKDTANLFKQLREDPDRGLFCLDWERYGDILASWGNQKMSEY